MSITSYHIYPSPIINDSRIFKEIDTLYRLKLVDKAVVVGSCNKNRPDNEFQYNGFLKIKRFPLEYHYFLNHRVNRVLGYLRWVNNVSKFLKNNVISADIIHCHTASLLPLCLKIKNQLGCSVLYDAHELESERAGIGRVRKQIIKQIEKKQIPKVDEMWVVGLEIANWYKKQFLIEPKIVYNFPHDKHTEIHKISLEKDFRQIFNIPEKSIIFLYQGVISFGRGIEKIIRIFKKFKINDPCVVFMGYGNLVQEVKKNAENFTNIYYYPAVPPNKLLYYTKGADIGLALIEPISLSYKYCLPNKLFEYVQAGLGIFASDLPEMSKFVSKSENGKVFSPNDPDHLLEKEILSLKKSEINNWKKKSNEIAHLHTWEVQENIIKETYNNLIGNKKNNRL